MERTIKGGIYSMNLYEKTVAQLEKKEPKLVYSVTRIPLTDKAKKFFGVYDFSKAIKDKYQLEKLNAAKETKQEKRPLVFQYIFYYDDPTQPEKERELEAIRASTEVLNRDVMEADKVVLGVDYDVTVEKMVI